MGTFTVTLFPDRSPVTVANFLGYVDAGFYDETILHRVIRDFVVQGGGYTRDCVRKETRPPIVCEAANGLSNRRYTLGMARTNQLNSATSQFYVNMADNLFLDHRGDDSRDFGYAVFAEVLEGEEVLERIHGVQTGPMCQFSSDVPLEPIIVLSVRRLDP